MEPCEATAAAGRRKALSSPGRLSPAAAGPMAARATPTLTLALPLAGGTSLVAQTVPTTRSVMPATVLSPRTPRAGHCTAFRLFQLRHVVEQAAGLLIRHEAGCNRGHHPSRGPELFEKGIERESRSGARVGPKAPAAKGAARSPPRGAGSPDPRGRESGFDCERALGPQGCQLQSINVLQEDESP